MMRRGLDALHGRYSGVDAPASPHARHFLFRRFKPSFTPVDEIAAMLITFDTIESEGRMRAIYYMRKSSLTPGARGDVIMPSMAHVLSTMRLCSINAYLLLFLPAAFIFVTHGPA